MKGAARPALATLVLLGAAAAWEARSFVVGFPTDPLGPRAFPWFASALLVLCGGVALGGWRRAPEPAGAPSDRPPVPPVLAVLSFAAFALLLEPLGFVVATALEFAVLARLFGGKILPGLVAGLVFAVVSFLLFVQLLGLPLPLGFWVGGA